MRGLVPGRAGSLEGGGRGEGGGGGGMRSESDGGGDMPRRGGEEEGVVGGSRCMVGSILDFFVSLGSGESGEVSGDGGDLRLNGEVDGSEGISVDMESVCCLVQITICRGFLGWSRN